MTGFVRKATLLTACGLLAAVSAMASVPSSLTSSCPGCAGGPVLGPFVRYVGLTTTGALNAHTGPRGGALNMVIRDFAGNPVASSVVELRSALCTDLVLCKYIPNGTLPTPQIVQCNNIVRGTTNALGQVTLIPLGGGTNLGASAGPGAGCVKIFADGLELSSATAIIHDQDGAVAGSGVTGLDGSRVLGDVAVPVPFHGRSDFSCPFGSCGTTTGLDFSQMLAVIADGAVTGSAAGCKQGIVLGNYCP